MFHGLVPLVKTQLAPTRWGARSACVAPGSDVTVGIWAQASRRRVTSHLGETVFVSSRVATLRHATSPWECQISVIHGQRSTTTGDRRHKRCKNPVMYALRPERARSLYKRSWASCRVHEIRRRNGRNLPFLSWFQAAMMLVRNRQSGFSADRLVAGPDSANCWTDGGTWVDNSLTSVTVARAYRAQRRDGSLILVYA